MDADDLCSPDRFKKQLNLLETDKKIDVVGCGMIYLDEKDKPLGRSMAVKTHDEICKEPYRSIRLCHASIMARTAWCRKYRYDETIHLGQDFNLWLRSYRESKFANITNPLYYYRLELSYNLRKQIKDRKISTKYLFSHYKNRGQLDKALFYSFVQYLKMVAEIGIYSIGFKDKFLARRYSRLNDEESALYIKEIQEIKDTKLPIKSL